MGMTIHYRASMDPARISELIRDMKSLALILGWGYTIFREGDVEEEYEPYAAAEQKAAQRDEESGEEADEENELVCEIEGHVPLSGIILSPHPECEAVWLLFDETGDLICLMSYVCVRDGLYTKEHAWASTKTQFAPVETHVLIVELLKHLGRKYFRTMEVQDEGKYFDTGDIRELCALKAKINRALDILADALENYMPAEGEGKTPEEVAEIVEQIVQEFQKNLDNEEDKGE